MTAFLTASKRSFDEIARAVGDDPTLQKYRAELMSGFGVNYLNAKGLDKASTAYDEALQIYRQLAAKNAGAIEWQRGIATQIDNIGVVLQQQGKIEMAMQNFEQSLAQRQSFVVREPNNPISYRDLASSEYNIGEIMMQLRKAKEFAGQPQRRS